MISIVNVGLDEPTDLLGAATYEVRINSKVIVSFKHKRSEGLGRCLFEAAKAVEKEKWEKAYKLI